jgi:2',3'-cyclic-nucleotide 2'-phosphodiesterase
MKIIFIGDVAWDSGRDALECHLPSLRNKYKPDAVIVNGENSAHGVGITPKIADWMLNDLGIDCITGGDHSFDKREIIPYMPTQPKLIRPANFPGMAGNGVYSFKTPTGLYVSVINMIGRVFTGAMVDCPFRSMDKILDNIKLKTNSDAIIVDFHAEATSEKYCFGHYLDGRVSAVLGTHTHVPTADHQILPKGTAYQSDVGMTGAYTGSIGVDLEIPMQGFLNGRMLDKMQPAKGNGTLCGVIIDINDQTGLAKNIIPIRMGGNELEQSI